MELVRTLDTLSRDDVATAGGKGANLGELIRGGFDVPPGFVVTTAAYDAYVSGPLAQRVAQIAAGVTSSSPASATNASRGIAEAFRSTPLPDDVAAAVVAAYEAMGGGQVAVRSSATAEDMAEASFAGQQDTYLGISTPEALLDAVRSCQASLWSERALAYRARLAENGAALDRLSLAVVVQRLVPAEVAGVMFTLNPTTGRLDETVVEAAYGLGEAIVSGLVTPAEYVVRGDAVTATPADQTVRIVATTEGTATEASTGSSQVLDDPTVRRLAAIGRQVARHFGAPQDIEWAIAGSRIHLLQARPVTAVAAARGEVPTSWPVPRKDGMYFRASIIEQLPDPLTPLFADMARPAVVTGLVALLTELMGTLDRDWSPDGMDFITINGYAYYEYRAKALWDLMKITPAAMPYLVGEARGAMTDRWRNRAAPAYRAVVDRWRTADLDAAPARTLLDGAAEVLTAGCTYYSVVQTIIPQVALAEVVFATAYDTLVRRRNDPAATTFVLGFDSAPLRAEHDLYEVARWVRTEPALAAALRDPAVDPRGPVPDGVTALVWEQWQAQLEAYLGEHGHTVFNLDFANPVPADDPASTLETLRFFVADTTGEHDPDRRRERTEAAREEATARVLERLDPVRRKLFTTLLDRAQASAPMREDALALVGLGWPALRQLLLQIGARLVHAGLLGHADDVFWLSYEEATAACDRLDAGTAEWSEADRDAQAALIAERQATWRGQRLATPPGQLPDKGWMHVWDRFMPTNESVQIGPVLKGLGASDGIVEGVARVLSDPSELAMMKPGEVLVASITTPAFTPLFAMASAVVTDVGGMLSHSSIVAREYGIPAVLGTGVATRRIRTGDRVRVDGDTGQVTLLDEPMPEPTKQRRWVPYALGAAVALGAITWWRRR